MVINHLERQFVPSDAGTIIRELDVEHLAAKLMIWRPRWRTARWAMAIIFCRALMRTANKLLRLGVTITDICDGFYLSFLLDR